MVVLTEERTLKSNVISADGGVCIICRASLHAEIATAGSLYADGRQAFACTVHLLRDRRPWIVFWAGFEAEQRRLQKTKGGAR